ncbi:MAG TPA: hypothetical protein VM223_27440 [Planctomycetota bacterium]|nr:hypothetical protein [Planctomycetota bacterium]
MAFVSVWLLSLIVVAVAAELLIERSARRRARGHLAGRRSLSDREFGELFPPELSDDEAQQAQTSKWTQ